jgi:hypothetical protein
VLTGYGERIVRRTVFSCGDGSFAASIHPRTRHPCRRKRRLVVSGFFIEIAADAFAPPRQAKVPPKSTSIFALRVSLWGARRAS